MLSVPGLTHAERGVYTAAASAKSLQSCLTLCDPMDCSLPGSSVHGILQATVLEWGATAFSEYIPHPILKLSHLNEDTAMMMKGDGLWGWTRRSICVLVSVHGWGAGVCDEGQSCGATRVGAPRVLLFSRLPPSGSAEVLLLLSPPAASGLAPITSPFWGPHPSSKLSPSTINTAAAAAAAKSLQSCPTLCDPIDGSPPGSPVPGILQPRTLEWVAISFSNAWKWKVKVKLLSRVRLLATPWTAAFQAPPSMRLSRQEYWSRVPSPYPTINTRHLYFIYFQTFYLPAFLLSQLVHIRPWSWKRSKAGGEGDDGGWDGWMASPIQWTWVWVNSGRWWWTGRPGVLQSMGLQRVGHDWVTEQQQQSSHSN